MSADTKKVEDNLIDKFHVEVFNKLNINAENTGISLILRFQWENILLFRYSKNHFLYFSYCSCWQQDKT